MRRRAEKPKARLGAPLVSQSWGCCQLIRLISSRDVHFLPVLGLPRRLGHSVCARCVRQSVESSGLVRLCKHFASVREQIPTSGLRDASRCQDCSQCFPDRRGSSNGNLASRCAQGYFVLRNLRLTAFGISSSRGVDHAIGFSSNKRATIAESRYARTLTINPFWK